MAFGFQKPGTVPAPMGSAAFNVFTAPMEFFREYNTRYYTGTENVVDVAIFHGWPTMAYSISAAYVLVTLMKQVLIQYKVPFGLLFEDQLDQIQRYAAVMLAGQECLSDGQLELFLNYARNGGTLVVTDDTAKYDEWREARVKVPSWSSRREGRGSIVYIPKVIRDDKRVNASDSFQDPEPGARSLRGTQLTPAQWVLPVNHQEIYRQIIAAMPKGLSIASDAPLATVMEILTRKESRETIVHFVNFEKDKPLAPFAVTVRKQFPIR
jgi:hypothetical protein